MGGTIRSAVGGLSGTIYPFSGAIYMIAGIARAGGSVDSRAGTVALGTGIARARWSAHSCAGTVS